MSRTYRPTLLALVAILACLVLGTYAQGNAETYCSPYNTGSTDVYTWDWQSNGNCTNHCKQEGNFAFAVIQYKDCYCSDYVPSPTFSLGDCAKDCPGFPDEHCGDVDKGLYIYLKLSGQPSGTKSAGGGAQPTSAPVSSSPPPPPSPSTPSPQAVSTSIVVVTSKKPASSSQTQDPQTSLVVGTESGVVVTRTLIITPSAGPTSSTAPVRTGDEDGGTNVGAIAGGVAGGVVGLLAIIGVLVFLLWRRRKQQQELENGTGGGSGITRNTSTMSKAGLLGATTEMDHSYPPQRSATFGTQSSRYGADQQSISPISNRRNSQPLVIDSRMNPQAMIEYAGANASRESIGTIDDSRDYGRKLDVRNPDQ